MASYTDVSSNAHLTHRYSSRPTRNSSSIYRQNPRSAGRSGPLSSASYPEYAEYLRTRPDPALHVDSSGSDDYTRPRSHAAFAESMFPGVGSQFQFEILPRNIHLFEELDITTCSPSNKHSTVSTPTVISKSQDSGSCTSCPKHYHGCLREQSARCSRCLAFDCACKLPEDLIDPTHNTLATKPVALRSLSFRPISATIPEPPATRQHTPKYTTANVQPSDKSNCCQISSRDAKTLPPSHESNVPSLIERFLELALQHSSHHEQFCSDPVTLSPRGEALVNQLPRSAATASGSAFFGVASTTRGSKPHTQQPSRRVSNPDSESDQDPGDEDEQNPPQDGDNSLGEASERNIACPFSKNRRYLRNHPRYLPCLGSKLVDMTALVQHLKRTHNFCCKCLALFQSSAEFSNHLPENLHCPRCHQSFRTYRELAEHRSKTRHERDTRSDREKWDSIWSQCFPGEPIPMSHYNTTLEDVQVADWIMALLSLAEDCRMRIGLHILEYYIVNGTTTAREFELFNRVFGQPMDPLATAQGISQDFQHDTTAFGYVTNRAYMSPVSNTEIPRPLITYQEADPTHHTSNRPRQAAPVPQTHPQHFEQANHGQNRTSLNTSNWGPPGNFLAYPDGMYNSRLQSSQSASQPHLQSSQFEGMLLPDRTSSHDGSMFLDVPRNYTHHSSSFNQNYATPTSFEQTPRSLASASTPYMSGFDPSDMDMGPPTPLDQNMEEERDMSDLMTYHP